MHSFPPSLTSRVPSDVGLLTSSPAGSSHYTEESEAAMTAGVSSMSTLEESHPVPRGDVPVKRVIKAFLSKNNILDISNVGRLGVLLARYSFFGDELLQGSTLKGKGSRPGLDPNIIDTLMAVIHNEHPFSLLNMTEFRQKIRPKIERSLTDFLKPKLKKAI